MRCRVCSRPPFLLGFLTSTESEPELSDESESLDSESDELLLLLLSSESLLSLVSESPLLSLLLLSLSLELESESLLSSELLELESEPDELLLLLLSESELEPLSEESVDEATSAFRFCFFFIFPSGLSTLSGPLFWVGSFSRSSGSRSLGSRYRRVYRQEPGWSSWDEQARALRWGGHRCWCWQRAWAQGARGVSAKIGAGAGGETASAASRCLITVQREALAKLRLTRLYGIGQ